MCVCVVSIVQVRSLARHWLHVLHVVEEDKKMTINELSACVHDMSMYDELQLVFILFL